MTFIYHSFVKIIDKFTDQIIKNFEDELLTNYYLTVSKKEFNINNKVIEIASSNTIKLIVFTSYNSIVICKSYSYENNVIKETTRTSNEHGITVFDDIPQCDHVLLLFHYIASNREGLMSTRGIKNEHNETVNVYKNIVDHKTIKIVPFNPGWEF